MIDGAQIVDIDPAPQVTVDETMDAGGLHLLPGVIDDQVHFREPGLEHKEDLESGTRGAVLGGVTGVFPTIYGNGLRIVQAPGYVVIAHEMVHESRIRTRGSGPGPCCSP